MTVLSRLISTLKLKFPFIAAAKTETFRCRTKLTVWVAAANLTILLHSIALLMLSPLPDRHLDFSIFVSVTIVVPIISAAVIWRCTNGDGIENTVYGSIIFSFLSIIIMAAIAMTCLAMLAWLLGFSVSSWKTSARVIVIGLSVTHLVMVAVMLFLPSRARGKIGDLLKNIHWPRGKLETSVVFSIILLVAMFILFRVEPDNSLAYVMFGMVAGITPKPGWGMLGLATILALLVLLGCANLLRFEDGLRKNQPDRLERIQTRALLGAVAAIFYFYFDFTFNSDVLHFLANVGPAAQIIYGDGVPMVSAFSQYGAGPLVMTWLGFLIDRPSFGSANVVTQLHSLTFYAVIIFCLYRMTPYRLTALVLGFAAIGIVLAGWWGGNYSLNSVPSAMGLRYLPCALVVLAISLFENKQKHSLFLFATLSLSLLWSFEALLGSVAIAGLFFLIKAISDRDLAGFIKSLVLGVFLPIAAGLAAMSAITLMWAGVLPDIATYLEFAKIYNLSSKFWAIPSNGTFLGWVPVAATVMTALSLAWLSAFGQARVNSIWNARLLLYRFVPMAGLTAFMSSYYVGRSVDFTLIISFLPFCALVIPVILVLFRQALSGELRHLCLAAPAAFIVFLALSFSFTALYRKDSPYKIALNQCLHLGICTPIGLAEMLKQRYRLKPMLDQAANPNYYDTTGLAREAIGLIQRYEPGRKRIALFLGIHPATIWSVHTDTVLLLAGKAHRWPISYVLSDELNPARRRQILAANIQLENGETIFIRKDEGRLGELEAAILRKIRAAAQLCPLPAPGKLVMAYRVSNDQACDVTLNRQTPSRPATEKEKK